MSDSAVKEVTSNADDAVEVDAAHDAHDHPSEGQYWIVFVILAIITAFEVLWSYMGLEGPALVVPLVVMMLVKFVVVAGIFMHLYFDMKLLNGKIFTMAFVAGIAVALFCFTVMVATFEFNI